MTRFAWIFDLDGTLFRSHDQIIETLNETRSSNNLSALDPEIAFKLIGRPAIEFLGDLDLLQTDKEQIILEFRNRLEEKLQLGTPIYDGAEESVKKLKRRNQITGIATMKPDSLANVMVKRSVFSEFIDHVQGSTGLTPKPDPEVLHRSMEALRARSAVLIGDRPEDILCAKNAGIFAIGVAQTSFSASELEAIGADFVYESLIDFAKDLEALKKKISP